MVSFASTERAAGVIAPSVASSLKRKHDNLSSDFDANELTSSQIKKRRVTFDPAIDIRILSDVNEKSQELVGEEVRRALERHANGDNSDYDQIRQLLALKPTSADAPLSRLLQKYIIALTNNVPLLDKSSGLVHAIIDSHWIARNEKYVRCYRHLLRSLLSVYPQYTSGILSMLVNMFLEQPSPALRQQDDPPVDRVRLQERIHDTLKYLLRQNSMTSTALGPILASTFPFPTDTAKAHVHYIRNVLRVSEYCPELKGQILSLVMDKLVKIDVQIQTDMDELEDDIEDRLVEEAANEEEDDISDDESVSSEESLSPEDLQIKQLKENVVKLDAIMDLLFSHYSSIFARGDLDDIDASFESLLTQFASIILPTYRSRHIQFLLFHFSQASPDLTERFAGACSALAFDQRQPHILRVSAAAYLASFIARGAHVSPALVRDIFDLLCHHLESLRAASEPMCKGPDLRRYGSYYAISQALLYTFCFRYRDLIATSDGQPLTDEELVYHDGDFTWHNSIQDILRRNIFSKLNPLKICAPTIVSQFARVAHHLRFLYVFPLIETNKRLRLARSLGSGYMDGVGARETALSMKKGEQVFLLDAYFPFDPYVLPRSQRWLEGDYVNWTPVPGMEPPATNNEDDEDEDEEGDEDEDDDDDSSSERGDEVEEEVELDDGSTEAST